MTKENKSMSFEEALTKLEEIVLKLEEEDVPLEKAIDYYQEGMKLSKLCDDILKNAQEKMTQILQEEKMEPFELQGE
ncbi:exodeoxyribonuclease VII small subunit [Pseudogracilibacillus auburnensis]|uniref:Exodeoxyribonuclease 7 small subunit n=1 Tax=Pseudogracilibacillus auburnensis TaxID=1494959 RepID=A0A2V3VVM8_9BACI|nr:exodeoxyribonuclease VII small subunit [Pseudogracilibacillus auburnensis]MBO1004302.1 exodeoxyribonuclease VII small subunit [Pseudogracilibacillus auburnensis]PXW85054.1 exodeoxyribonuclease VII small subunit [Pseudogracilibacillus auburnensis]